MTSKEFKSWIEEYKSGIKKTGYERPLDDTEIQIINQNIENIPNEYREAFDMAREGNFSKFEKLPYLLRNYLGAIELKKFRAKFGDDSSLQNEEVAKYLEDNAMNAALRAGISAEKNHPKTSNSANSFDAYMNACLMKRTMMPPTDEEKAMLTVALNGEDKAAEAILRNEAKQLVLAKAMLLAQIGKYDLMTKNGLSRPLDAPIYETLVHGSRINFVLPAGLESALVLDAFMSPDAGIEKRTAATHSVKTRTIDKNGAIDSDTEEIKTYSPLKIFTNQYGMNIAAGGIGRKGPHQGAIVGDGEAGHVYMRLEHGDAKHCASLLLGVEGSAPGKTNYLGNAHDFRAKSAKQSPFLADKKIVGKKVGGRQVDLSGLTSRELADLLNRFSEKYTALQRSASSVEGAEKLSKVNDMLMGKYMDVRALAQFFMELDMVDERLPDLLSNARRGYVARIDVKNITSDEFKNNIRAKFSQEKACSIAKSRFEYANDDLELAVGAIKELMLTHETRTLGWKILHPIKNSREKKTISTLLSRLETEKGFALEDIASALVWNVDTFSMNWGNELSNDRDAILFAKESNHLFKPSEEKLPEVLMNAYNDIRDKLGDVVTAQEEILTMQNELDEIKEAEAFREQIVVAEENEANKSDDLSLEIIPEQPILENQLEL